ncbi:hypothetical protein SARC_10703 [Sphaeroforma arctica JP610]|uniref:6-phosphofructo-2-kinase domain-containing protein n=1 Tax=Sphaeroforma arctica JP610 TaxID=667725 RepID=A0A0L0FJ58_9EUKA|nr:hypothetical protein SARC_10703 [Sphaeroforma arctica JP610]KNC76819.1 hypothetical protein SARC_10703 [Sphaeroforma arctica JP610]|eukprot:XP_014150721.1 hypothetical protein SARC_10703 [Sphaeroforma arctica JP610]
MASRNELAELTFSAPRRKHHQTKVLFAMVGLPARGKSFISNKISSYLNWTGIPCEIFNAGSYRRKRLGADKSGRADFFDTRNSSNLSQRDHIAMATLDDALQFLEEEGERVAVFDATNTTRERRRMIYEKIKEFEKTSVKVTFICLESICDDPEVLDVNLRQKIRGSPDFQNMAEEDALRDLRERIKRYESVYEEVDDSEKLSYVKVINLNAKVVCSNVFGKTPLRVVQLLMSCNVYTRPVYLCRAGHCDGIVDMSGLRKQVKAVLGCQDEILGRARGPYAEGSKVIAQQVNAVALDKSTAPESSMKTADATKTGSQLLRCFSTRMDEVYMPSMATASAELSDSGNRFAQRVAKFIRQEQGAEAEIDTYTSTLPRAVATAMPLMEYDEDRIEEWSALSVLNTGIMHGLKVSSIRREYPAEFNLWKIDPFRYRFPGGESLYDLNQRLVDVVLQIEHTFNPVLVVSHLSTIQSLLAYFQNIAMEKAPMIEAPQHSVIVLKPSNYGWSIKIVTEDELPEL